MEEKLEPIPSPPGHLAREFCHRVLPIGVFVAVSLAVAVLWNQRFTGTTLFGEVEPIRANVTTLEGGTLASLDVERFQTVTNGQVIGAVQVIDADTLLGDLAVLRSELNVMRSRLALDEARNDQNVETIRLRWQEARVELATSRVNLENARRELERAERLAADLIMSESELDLARAVHDALAAETREREALVSSLGTTLDRLDDANRRDHGGAGEVLEESLRAQEKRLQQQRQVKLRAPMDGVVKIINNHPGERLPAGAIVAIITAPHSERIVGYVRQPLTLEPRPGMPVEIRTRGPRRQVVQSQILGVGSDLELVVSPLRLRGFDNSVERGLAFFVALPPELQVHPGELVDLIVRPSPPAP